MKSGDYFEELNKNYIMVVESGKKYLCTKIFCNM